MNTQPLHPIAERVAQAREAEIAAETPTLRRQVAEAFTFHNGVRINLLKSSKPKREKTVDAAFQDGMMAAYQDVLNMLDGRGL